MNQPEALIFDLDAIVPGLAPLHTRAWEDLASRVAGRPCTLAEDQLNPSDSPSTADADRIVEIFGLKPDARGFLLRNKGPATVTLVQRAGGPPPPDGFAALHRLARACELKVAVTSATARRAVADAALAQLVHAALGPRLFVAQAFDAIVCADDDGDGAAAGDGGVYAACVRKLGCRAKEACVFLPGRGGAVAAAAAAGVRWTFAVGGAQPNAYKTLTSLTDAVPVVSKLLGVARPDPAPAQQAAAPPPSVPPPPRQQQQQQQQQQQ